MKNSSHIKLISYTFLVFFMLNCAVFSIEAENNAYELVSIALPAYQKYINFLTQLTSDSLLIDYSHLFDENVIKTVNSETICTNRDQLFIQLYKMINADEISSIRLLHITECDCPIQHRFIDFEVKYKDSTTKILTSELKYNQNEKIIEINENFYQLDIC